MDGVAPPRRLDAAGLVAVPLLMAETSNVDGLQAVGPTSPRQVSCTYASGNIAFGRIRFVASDAKAMKRPLKLNTGSELLPFGAAPFAPVEIALAPPGGPGSIVKETVLESGEPSGFETKIYTQPRIAIAPAGIWSVTIDEFTNVTSPPLKNPGFPGFLQTRSAPERKWLPFTVRVNAAPPAGALQGAMEGITGERPRGGGGANCMPGLQPDIPATTPT